MSGGVGRMGTAMALAAVIAAVTGGAWAATYPVDDSASLPGRSSAAMKWRTPGPSRLGGDFVDGATAVTLILHTAPWLGRTGRIYMKLGEQPIGPVRVEWTTQGRMLPGVLNSGDRALVYAGPIRARQLADTLFLQVHADGRRLNASQNLRFQFEIDVD